MRCFLDAMNMQNSTKNSLLALVTRDYPRINFVASTNFYWSPKENTVYFSEGELLSEQSQWSLLHELSHGLLGHKNYKNDFELLSFELDAWEQAKKIASGYSVSIDEDHVEDCLDTYRDWLHARSCCPTCKLNGIQLSSTSYKCMNCKAKWTVSPSRFCRPYRLSKDKQKSSQEDPAAILFA
jgi:hypothetical protein